jgi:uridine kinase
LLFDGVFAARPELVAYWDFLIWLQVSPATTLERALAHDLARWGSAEAVRQRYLSRYIPAQKLYQLRCRPQDRANIVILHDVPDAPVAHWQGEP